MKTTNTTQKLISPKQQNAIQKQTIMSQKMVDLAHQTVHKPTLILIPKPKPKLILKVKPVPPPQGPVNKYHLV